MRGLAQRLRARAQSLLVRHQPEQHRDLLIAASLIEGIARSSDLLVDVTEASGEIEFDDRFIIDVPGKIAFGRTR